MTAKPTKQRKHLPQVLLVGRVNVGKSTLFNRLAGASKALVSDIPGTTRDTKYTTASWNGTDFELIDTGGFLTRKEQTKDSEETKAIQQEIQRRTERSLGTAKLVLFVVDIEAGITPHDREIARMLHAHHNDKTILLVANKADGPRKRAKADQFTALGMGDPIPVSAANGSGSGDLLDEMTKYLSNKSPKPDPSPSTLVPIKICILGKPNVGKSTLLNQIIGEDKAIVSPQAHTTREPNEETLTYKNAEITIIDTAGIRKKVRQGDPLEKGGVSLSRTALKEADIAWLVLDAADITSVQDRKLAEEVTEVRKGCLILVNKWDTVPEKDATTADLFTKTIHGYYPHLSWARVAYISGLTGRGVSGLLDETLAIQDIMNTAVTDNALSNILAKAIKKQPPPRVGAKKQRPFLSRLRQIDHYPPRFACESNLRWKLPESYKKYLENQIREKINLHGTPISVDINLAKE